MITQLDRIFNIINYDNIYTSIFNCTLDIQIHSASPPKLLYSNPYFLEYNLLKVSRLSRIPRARDGRVTELSPNQDPD